MTQFLDEQNDPRNAQIRNAILDDAQKSQFDLSNIAYHTHNGSDSPNVPAQFLDFTNFAIWGQVQLSGGAATITNQNIVLTSVVLLTSQTTEPSTLSANSINGKTTIGGGVAAEVVNYLIIF